MAFALQIAQVVHLAEMLPHTVHHQAASYSRHHCRTSGFVPCCVVLVQGTQNHRCTFRCLARVVVMQIPARSNRMVTCSHSYTADFGSHNKGFHCLLESSLCLAVSSFSFPGRCFSFLEAVSCGCLNTDCTWLECNVLGRARDSSCWLHGSVQHCMDCFSNVEKPRKVLAEDPPCGVSSLFLCGWTSRVVDISPLAGQ